MPHKLNETYQGYKIIIQIAMSLDGTPPAYLWKLHKPWPNYTSIIADDLYDTAEEALQGARAMVDEIIKEKQA